MKIISHLETRCQSELVEDLRKVAFRQAQCDI